MPSSSRPTDYVMMGLSVVCGAGSIALFAAWPFDLVPMRLGDAGTLLWDALLSIAFFVQHSVMVRRPVKARLARVVAERYVGAIYSIASGVVLAAVVVLWQRSPTVLLVIEGPLRWLTGALSVLALAAFVWGVLSLRGFDPLGLGPVRAHLRRTAARASPFTVRGAYRWVRHPLYASILVLFWTEPLVTLDRLLFDVLWTSWIVVGSVLEEADLVAEFGDRYVDYRRKVPMLIPWHAPRT
jgi:protein-S-isoprenylcysteine O-methyltransferase Ste14